MKKFFLLSCACLSFLIIQANTANASGSKYFFEHQPIAAGSNMKAAYGDGKQLVASYKPNYGWKIREILFCSPAKLAPKTLNFP